MIEIKNLNKSYGNKVIFKNLNLTLDMGMYKIEGVNGLGKSTLLEILSGNDLEYSGNILINRKKYTANQLKQRICFITQEDLLIEELSGGENINLFASHIDEEYLKKLLSKFKVEKIIDYKVCNLSGGEKQKIKNIIGFLSTKNILIFDEPTNNLDEQSIKNFYQELDQIKEKMILLVTHNEVGKEIKKISLEKENFEYISEQNDKQKIIVEKKKLNIKNGLKIIFSSSKNFLVIITALSLFLIIFSKIILGQVYEIQKNYDSVTGGIDSNVVVLSNERDSNYCNIPENMETCYNEQINFSQDDVAKIKEIEEVTKVEGYNYPINLSFPNMDNEMNRVNFQFDIEDSKYELYIDKDLYMNTLDSFDDDKKELSVSGNILVFPKEISEKLGIIASYTNVERMLLGEFPEDETEEVMIDEQLAVYAATKLNLKSINELVGMEIQIPVYDSNNNKVTQNKEVSGIYVPLKETSSKIIYSYDENSSGFQKFLLVNETSKDDMYTEYFNYLSSNEYYKGEILSKEEFKDVVEGDVQTIYAEFKTDEAAEKFYYNVKESYPYLYVDSQVTYKEGYFKDYYEKTMKRLVVILNILIFITIYYLLMKNHFNLKKQQIKRLKRFDMKYKVLNNIFLEISIAYVIAIIISYITIFKILNFYNIIAYLNFIIIFYFFTLLVSFLIYKKV